MQRLGSVSPAEATGKAKTLLDAVQAKLGMTPNLMQALASSPAALEAYLNMNGALSHGMLPAKLRERIAVFIADKNGCGYCASAHTAIGKQFGLTESELRDSQAGIAADAKIEAALRFVQAVMDRHGKVSDEEVQQVRQAGYSDGEITEIIAHVGLNTLTNYFNNVAQTEIDFPKVELFSASR